MRVWSRSFFDSSTVRRSSGAAGLHRTGRSDTRCVHRFGAAQPQYPRGKRGDQERRGARGMGRQPGKAELEGCGCSLDQETGQEPLRLQESREGVPQAQAGARRYHVSDAALHDSQAVDHLLTRGNTGTGVWSDSADRSEDMESRLSARKLIGHIQCKGKQCKPLTDQAKGSNRTKSKVGVRVERSFGAQTTDMCGTLVRTIGMVRAKARIGMKNLAYNRRRLSRLRRVSPFPA